MHDNLDKGNGADFNMLEVVGVFLPGAVFAQKLIDSFLVVCVGSLIVDSDIVFQFKALLGVLRLLL